MNELMNILQKLLGRVFPQFGTVSIRVSIVDGQIETIRLEDITIAQTFKRKDLPNHVA